MIRDFFKNGLINHNFPISVDNTIIDGNKIRRNGVCTKECHVGNYTTEMEVIKCQHGFTHYLKSVSGVNLAIVEVISDNAKLTRKYRGRNVNLLHASEWFNYVSLFSKELEESVFKKASQDFDKFHEVTKWCDQIHHYSFKILKKHGANIKEAEKNAPNDIKSLYKSSVMLKDSLETAGIYFNPNAAKYGRRRSTDIYRMIDKIVRVVEHSEGSSFNKKIRISGVVEKHYDVFESFKIIPMSFIQNAIKYSSSNEIKVRFEEFSNQLLINFISTGNYISEQQLSRLFERGYRTPWAKQVHHDGKGLGLYVSKIVADAHKFEIGAKSMKLAYEYNGNPQAENLFYLKISTSNLEI
ncbi:ATP-binding protein [Grimontia hollisae]|uniref:histidine kinase n=1 Tax=Grimontia hollisae CIP 101886 TaxID=675812 RepID=D0I3G7_GRIHO|nr:ATP-binding protein [Grimontia hollisae]AMG30788.1 ATP-binding protein [Grimontia hollisae]EEY73988.1 hypothetical protein VHA_000280 [Grimontia hollisae CIP 101886]STO47406.1 sensor kinase CusS [Grimontia hollisae]